MLKKKTILVTGSTGFIGRNIIEKLSEQYVILHPKHRELDLFNSSETRKYIKDNKLDMVIHCAASGVIKKNGENIASKIIDGNLRMFFNISNGIEASTSLFVIGSGAEYNKDRSLQKVPETDAGEILPSDAYGFSKYVISKFASFNDNLYILRLFGIYGRYEDYTNRFISNSIIKNILHLPIVINQNVVFDYLYVDDFCKILKNLLVSPPKYRILNLTPTESIDLVTIAEIINEVSEYSTNINIIKNGINKEYTGSNLRLIKEIGPFEFTSYKDGIKNLYEYHLKHIDEIDEKKIADEEYLRRLRDGNKLD